MSRYHEVYAAWKNDPEEFWGKAAQDISWYKLWDKVFDPYMGEYGRWFVGSECNTAYNCLDRHVEAGRGNQPAIIYDSPITSKKRSITYAELTDEVIEAARASGNLPPQPDEDMLDDFEIDESEDETDEETGDLQ